MSKLKFEVIHNPRLFYDITLILEVFVKVTIFKNRYNLSVGI